MQLTICVFETGKFGSGDAGRLRHAMIPTQRSGSTDPTQVLCRHFQMGLGNGL